MVGKLALKKLERGWELSGLILAPPVLTYKYVRKVCRYVGYAVDWMRITYG